MAHEELQRRIEASFAQQGLMRVIEARIAEVRPGRCTIEAPFRKTLTQQHGFLHAGVLTTLADNACGYASLSLLPAGQEVLTAELKVNFLRPARGVLAIARAEVLKPGRTLTVARAEVWMRSEDGTETLCAAMQATLVPSVAI
ncbi:PaaI family thioesterase [Roseococcus sp. DSY-14]|uniref:PaaI family thioesterase n=1 Tax=Roseococcus sp. DSY-14 TaxID=3369650 RepID=UPI00387B86A6